VNLAVGITLLIVATLFVAWALLRPLGRELEAAEAEAEEARDERRFEKDERSAARPARVPETR
jgi:flagellar biosynthesis/type III secretory pathway M-ring protein FliF/YscJ